MLAPAAARDHEGLVLNVALEARRRRERTRGRNSDRRGRQTERVQWVFFIYIYIVEAMIGERKRDRQTGSLTEDWLMK